MSARNMKPTKRMPRRIAIIVIVLAAFRDSGGLNAGTPLAIASTPVSATEPPAKARSSRKIVSASAPGTGTWGWDRRGRELAGHRPEEAQPERPDGQRHEQVGRRREDVAGLAQAPQVADRDESDRSDADLDPPVVKRRPDRVDLGHRRGSGDGHRHHVVDHQRAGRDEPEGLAQVLLAPRRRRRRPTGRPGRPGGTSGDDGQHQRDCQRDLDGELERHDAAREQGDENLLRRVGGGRDRVRAEDREGELLRESLQDLLLVRQGTAEQEPADVRPRLRQPGARGGGRLLGGQHARARVAEVRRVRAVHANAPVPDLAALEGPATTDHAKGISPTRRPALSRRPGARLRLYHSGGSPRHDPRITSHAPGAG